MRGTICSMLSPQLKNKSQKILLIGATGGIGSATAQTLMDQKVIVLGTGRRKKIKATSLTDYFPLDLTKERDVRALAQNIKKLYGSNDWVIRAAGYIDLRELKNDHSSPVIEKTFSINTYSILFLSKAFTPLLRKGGGFLALSSTAGIFGNPQFPIYSSSKGALNTLCIALARSLAPKKLSCMVLCPGPTNTSMRERIAHDASRQQDPKIIANVIARIIRNESPYKNGDVVIIRD